MAEGGRAYAEVLGEIADLLVVLGDITVSRQIGAGPGDGADAVVALAAPGVAGERHRQGARGARGSAGLRALGQCYQGTLALAGVDQEDALLHLFCVVLVDSATGAFSFSLYTSTLFVQFE